MLGVEAGGGLGADLIKLQVSQGSDLALRQKRWGRGWGGPGRFGQVNSVTGCRETKGLLPVLGNDSGHSTGGELHQVQHGLQRSRAENFLKGSEVG